MEKKPTAHKRKAGLAEAKLFLTTLSIAATLGAWQFFVRQEVNTAVQSTAEAQAPQVAQVAVDLPPLPTLVPPLAGSTMVEIQARSVEQPSRILLGGAAPQQRPAPIARTGSSR